MGILQVPDIIPFTGMHDSRCGLCHYCFGHPTYQVHSSQDVLQKEASVQRDPTNAQAWYELGVKQQENEREKEAIQALRRAIEHDPGLSDAWLALAVSYTNESEPAEAYDAIEHWILGNERYRRAIGTGQSRNAESLTARQRCNKLINTIMGIIRGNPEVDADTQIALAVLLNTIEVSSHLTRKTTMTKQ